MLVKQTVDHDFVRDKTALFFVRDPRDILVSSYYSFGMTHALAKLDAIRELQEERRRLVREKTLDEYVLYAAEKQNELFRVLYDLSNACARSVILRYEDMVNRFDSFAGDLERYVSFKVGVVQSIYEKSRPKEKEDLTSHRRSGQVQGFRQKLRPETIAALNEQLAETLALFGYEV
ncbi:MAG: sulfotransferase domain-containing protein [Planctomycetota bacterium]